MKDAILALLSSRKFLASSLAVISIMVLVLVGKVPAGDFVASVTALSAVLVGAIAYEDKSRNALEQERLWHDKFEEPKKGDEEAK